MPPYAIHIVDETVMNGGFIRRFQLTFWPTYKARMNFWFNAGAVLAITASNLLFDLFVGHWVILALIWPFGFALHVAASRESAHNAGDGVVPLEGHEGGLATEATQVPVAHLNAPWGQPAVRELIGQERLKLFR